MVTNVWRSRRLAGTTSTPPGQRSRSAARWLVELEARDEAEDVVRLLLLGGERLEVAADRARGGDLDLRDVDLRSRRHDGLILPALGKFIAQELVTRVRLDVVDGEARGEPALHDLVLFRPSALLDLDDVVAEVRLDRIGDLPDLESARGVLELLHELALPHPAELAARVRGAGIVRFVLRELVPERLAVRIQAQLIADRGRFRERVVHLERLVGRVLVGLDEDVAAAELAPVVLVSRIDRVRGDRHAVGPGLEVEDRMLDEGVQRAPLERGLLLSDLRVVFVSRRYAELDVEARLLVLDLPLPLAERDGPAFEAHRGLEVVLIELVARRPRDQPQDEEKDRRKDDDDERLLAALPLPTSATLPAGEARKRDPSGPL